MYLVVVASLFGPVLCSVVLFFLMIRRPPRSTLDRSSAASDVYKRQEVMPGALHRRRARDAPAFEGRKVSRSVLPESGVTVSYTHLRAHETVLDLVCRLLLEKKTNTRIHLYLRLQNYITRAQLDEYYYVTEHLTSRTIDNHI